MTSDGRAPSAVIAILLLLFLAERTSCQFDEDSCPEGNSCISLTNCPSLLSLLQNAPRPTPLSIRVTLQRAQCGFEGTRPRVCCPQNAMPRPSNPTPAPSNPTPRPVNSNQSEYREDPPDVTNHPNLRLLTTNCGEVEDNKIIGGNKTGVLDFPWMALLAYTSTRGLAFRCGGTIINERYVLTAAHCITNLGGQTLTGVRVGEHNVATEQDCEGSDDIRVCADPVQDFSIEEILPHPNYSATRLREDIGLLRLSASINLSRNNVMPICLPTSTNLRNSRLEGRTLVVAGWGATETGNSSPDLLRVNLPVLTNRRCGEIHNRSVPAGIGFRQVCAGGIRGVDSCGGDSGGPLMIPDFVAGVQRYVQFGIVSFGPRRCGQPDIPGVYTRIVYYMDWVLDQLRP